MMKLVKSNFHVLALKGAKIAPKCTYPKYQFKGNNSVATKDTLTILHVHNHTLSYILSRSFMKVSKGAKIRNRYN